MDSQTLSSLCVGVAFSVLIGFVIFFTRQANREENLRDSAEKDDLLGTGNKMIATQIKRDIVEIRREVDKLIDSAVKLNELSQETLEKLRERAKDEPITSAEFKMLVRQTLKEFQEIRNMHPDKDYEYLVGRAIKILLQLAY
ncbi:MAG: hypothetical protein Q8R29_03125 [bacterium]|nr:hypothetical protein [bacterium]